MLVSAPSLRPKSLHAILGWWAQELGVNVPELQARADGVTLSPSSNLPGVFLFLRDRDLRIAALFPKLADLQEAIIGHTFRKIFTPKFWEALPEFCGSVIGPAFLYYADAILPTWTFAAPRGLMIRGLTASDAKSFAEFADNLSATEREHCGLELGPRPMWGIFKGKEMIAGAGYDAWPGRIAHIGVAVHPEHRGKNLGQIVVQAAARGALTRRRIVQYRTLAENAASVGLAKALGLEVFAETLYLRPPSRA